MLAALAPQAVTVTTALGRRLPGARDTDLHMGRDLRGVADPLVAAPPPAIPAGATVGLVAR